MKKIFCKKILFLFVIFFLVSAVDVACAAAVDSDDLAVHFLYEATVVEKPEAKAALFKRVADECAGTAFAPEALWRLSQLYVDGFDVPDMPNAVRSLERFIAEYPKSEWFFNVQMTLLGYYESQKNWKSYIALAEKILSDKNIPQKFRDEISRKRTEAQKK